MSDLLARFHALPRAARWLAAFGGVLVAYFVIVEPILILTNDLNSRADAAASAIAGEQALANQWSGLQPVRSAFGNPQLPGLEAQRKQALYTRVNQILDKHRVRPEITERNATLRDDQAAVLLDGADHIDRLILDISFDAEPRTVTAIMADFEQSPEIASISRVQIRKVDTGRGGTNGGGGGGGGRKVHAVLSPEAWVRIPAGAGGRS